MWTAAQTKAFERAIATCRDCLPMIERLEEIARVAPDYQSSVDTLRTQHDYLETMALTALGIADQQRG